MSKSQRPFVRFAHLTDLHFTTLAQSRYPTTNTVLEAAIDDLNSQDLDFVLFTGDLFHFPERIGHEIDAMLAALSRLKHPFYVGFGNHDVEGYHVDERKRFLMRELNDHGLSRGMPYYHVAPAPGIRLIMLDSTDTDDSHYLTWRGRFSQTQADWLSDTLSNSRNELAIIGVHHPPITPYPLMGSLKFEAADQGRLRSAIESYSHVPLVLCGHYHISSSAPFASTRVLTGPSLVEHPHQYRVLEVQPLDSRHEISFYWRSVPLDEAEDAPCAIGTALRHMALNRLSFARQGKFSAQRVK